MQIFKNGVIPPKVSFDLIIKISREFKLDPKENKLRIPIIPNLNQEITWGFFDGASQGHPPRCGVRVVLFFKQNHFLHIRYSPRRGSNSREDVIVLWTLIEIARKQGNQKLQILSDSKLVVDWVNKKKLVYGIYLSPLL
jgi:hypothetical protein